MDYNIEIADNPAEVYQFLEDKIYQHNASSTGKSDGRFFSLVIRDKGSTVIAGITGWAWAATSEITYLWVDNAHRNKGLGKQLLAAAEQALAQWGCKAILIRSYSFQAPGFYEKEGYNTVFVLEDFPRGYKYYSLLKRMK